jgi:hypothetical protein
MTETMTLVRWVVKRAEVAVAACVALLLSTGTALALTPQQYCDYLRIRAWKKFQYCVDTGLEADVKGVTGSAGVDWYAWNAKCRHIYFKNWAKAQKYTGSTCVGPRFTDNGDQTVTDNLSGLTWEKKTNDDTVHDMDNQYQWSTGSPWKGNGVAFAYFLLNINENNFGGANDWRLPTLAELQTIILDFECTGGFGPTCRCPSSPCAEPALGATSTAYPGHYWSASNDVIYPENAWGVAFGPPALPDVVVPPKSWAAFVRAVRGGW